jgi:choline dehydrogenase-like flavoprotein
MTASGSYDAIIVGSGAGGSAAAYQLARLGLRVALVEKGVALPGDGSTLDFHQVTEEGRFKSREQWQEPSGRRFCPEEYFNVGGKTKWYGAALLRYGRHEFAADSQYQCAGWPFTYEELLPYYEHAEGLLGVRRFACEPDLQRIAARLVRRAPHWRHEPLPLGLSPGILENSHEARHFDGFASVARLKADAQTAFLEQIPRSSNFTLITGRAVTSLLGNATDPEHVEGVRLQDGAILSGRAVLLAAGALHSPRLLQEYLETHALTGRLACAANVGRYLKYHLLTAVVAISTARTTDLIRKTLIFFNSGLAHSSVQPLGFDGEFIGTLMPKGVPRRIARFLGDHAYGFFLQTEDGAHRENRVIAAPTATGGLPVLDYDPARTPAALNEHRQLVRSFRKAAARIGMIAFSERIGIAGTAHVSGTLRTGIDPSDSVVDPLGQVHGMTALYVVDGSVLPRSSRVNPSLTIYAWSLRAAERLAERLVEERRVGECAK